MRKRWRLTALIVLAVILAAWSYAVRPPRTELGGGGYEAIQIGMSRCQVEGLIGPPGDHRYGPTLLDMDTIKYELKHGLLAAGWVGDHRMWIIGFDGEDRVGQKQFWDNQSVPQGRVENLLWRTKRQWHGWFP